MKRAIALCLWLLSFELIAQNKVTLVEYFFDTDPGYGNAKSVPVTESSDLEVNFVTTSLKDGFHTLFVRAKNNKDNWSFKQQHNFFSGTSVVTGSKIEYFIDTDPGLEKGIPITATGEGEQSFLADLSGISNGYHSLFVRVRDNNGNWSFKQQHNFFSGTSVVTGSKIEYFIDTDPGLEKGTPITATGEGEQGFLVDLSGISNGYHSLFVRVRDNNGNWSFKQQHNFFIGSSVVTGSQMEYFIDTDPGLGKGNLKTVTGEGEQSFLVDLSGISNGYHTLFVRVQDNNGNWSFKQQHAFYKANIPGAINIEYFFDNDPGMGKGNIVPIDPTVNNLYDKILELDVTKLTTGEHTLFVRAVDASGNISFSAIQQVTICEGNLPQAGFTYQNTNSEIVFTDNSKYAETYKWEFGDSTTETIANPKHSYKEAGIYTVKQIVSNNGCGSDTAKVAIDKSVIVILQPDSVAQINIAVTPKVVVTNYKSERQTFSLKYVIANSYSDSITNIILDPYQSFTAEFKPWNPVDPATYVATCTATINGNPYDQKSKNIKVSNGSGPEIYSIDPTSGKNGLKYNIDITGIRFQPNIKAILYCADFPSLVADLANLEFIDDKYIKASLDLADVPEGVFHLKVTNPDGSTYTLYNAFQVDLSGFIINPYANEDSKGWTFDGPVSSLIQNTAHWTGASNPYFSLGNPSYGGWTTTMTQTITTLPAGTYVLTVAGRAATETAVSMTVAGVPVDFAANGSVGGEIWQNAKEGSVEKTANNGAGFGWSYGKVTFTTDGTPFDIQVKGTTSAINQWFEIDNFTLNLSYAAELNVSFPGNVNQINYKGSTLRLTNLVTNEKVPVITAEKQTYTFSGLTILNRYKIELLTNSGEVLAEIDTLKLNRGANSVILSGIKTTFPVSMQVLTPSKVNVTHEANIQWYDFNNHFLVQGKSLSEMAVGTIVHFSISFNTSLGSQYMMPKEQTYTVIGGNNNIVYTLQPIDSVKISGVVLDENKWAISGATVAVAQMLNGRFAKNNTTMTDKDGKYSMTVYNDSSKVSYSYPEYISQSNTYAFFNNSAHLDTVVLIPVTGKTITTNLTFTSSVAQGVTATKENYYSNYQNVSYQLFNLTKNKAVSDVYVQYPELIIQDKTNVNDQIRITASSRDGEFSPKDCIITINPTGKDTATFDLVELGGIKATFGTSTNSSNLGILYDAQGQLFRKGSYYNSTLTFSKLPDASYTLVSMAGSEYFNEVLNLAGLTASGLTEGKDYKVKRADVVSGIISNIWVDTIPAFDESKFYYTGTNTSFSVNKTSVVAGNYVTLRARLDFKGEYTGKVGNVILLVDIPVNCSVVKNSVMIGTSLAPYLLDGNRITIPLNGKTTEQVRFCIAPTIGGNYMPNAFVKFDVNDKTVTQPIGSASFTATDMSILVPAVTAKKTIPINGTASAFSTVSIYDGSTLIGQTTALGTGVWMTSCELFDAYNLTTHPISAKIYMPGGITIQTETKKVLYDVSAIEVKTVTMINTAHPATSLDTYEYVTVFDFQHPKETTPPYWYWPAFPDFTFKIDFTNNDTTAVSNVTLYVKTSDNKIVPITATYDKEKDIWLATKKFFSNSLPVNVSVDYHANTNPLVDGDQLIDYSNKISGIASDYASGIAEIEAAFKNPTDSTITVLSKKLGLDLNQNVSNFDVKAYEAYLSNMSEERFKQYGDSLINALELEIPQYDEKQGFLNKVFEMKDELSYLTDDGSKLEIRKCNGLTRSMMEGMNFKIQTTSNQDTIYVKSDSLQFSIVNFSNDTYITLLYPALTKKSLLFAKSGTLSAEDQAEKSKRELEFVLARISDLSIYIIELFNTKLKDLLEEGRDIDDKIMQAIVLIDETKNPFDKAKWIAWKFTLEQLKAYNQFVRSAFKQIGPYMKKVINVAGYIDLIASATEDLNTLGGIYGSIPNPCINDQVNANAYKTQANILAFGIGTYYTANVMNKVSSSAAKASGAIAAVATGGTSLIAVIWGCVQEAVVSFAMDWAFNHFKDMTIEALEYDISLLQCEKPDSIPHPKPKDPNRNPKDDPNNPQSDPNNPNGDPNNPTDYQGNPTAEPDSTGNGHGPTGNSGSGNANPVQDPSGYVYEAVSSNRLEGVVATIYFRTNEPDMYGDLHEVITKWDASQYYQGNPDTTDINGIYAWDVPVGLWQVKYEKPGFETKYSEWLSVPPPQLDLNVGLLHPIPPTVKKVRTYEEGINIAFDKYMKLATMTNQQIKVTYNGSTISGTVRMLNEEEGYAADTAKYVSKVRFIPDHPWAVGDIVTITIKSLVESYAGTKMANDYSQTLVIEKEVKSIAADSTVLVQLNGNKTITVSVSPAEASKGKKVLAHIASSSILSMPFAEAILDEKGQAQFTVKGDLPGATTVKFTVYDVDDLFAASLVTVNPYPAAAGPITGPANVCRGSSGVTYSVPAIEGATSYYWILPDGSEGSSVTNSISVNYIASAISDTLYVQGLNSWGYGPYSKMAVTVNTIPVAAGPISGNATICKGTEATYTVPEISGATSYIWSLPVGATGNSTTNSITVTYTSNFISGNIMVNGNNTCGDGVKDTLVVNVNPSCSSHFVPVWSGNGYEQMNINIYSAKIDSVDLEAGDEIAIFDGTLCVGSGILTKGISRLSTFEILASMDDGTGNGYTPGNAITYKLYDKSKSTEIANVGVAYSDSLDTWIIDGKFSANETAFVALSGRNIVKQDIPMIAGWNIISTYVVPADVNLKDIFQSMINSGNLKKLMDEAGRTLENFGIFGGWKNNIGNLIFTEGYKVKMGVADTLSLEGTLVPLPLVIPLTAGWNIISYPCTTEQDGKALSQSLIDARKIMKVMDESGKTIENFGIFGGWKNNIGNFVPGKAYKVKVASDTTLTIPAIATKAAAYVPEVLASTHFIKVFEGNGTDHMNVSLVDLQASGLQAGDEIGIFDGSYCVGSATIGMEQINSGSISIPASANEGNSTSVNGFTIGNTIGLQLYRGNQSYKLETETLAGSQSFEKNGSVFIKVSASDLPVVQVDNSDNLFSVYPNPFTSEITIEVWNSEKAEVDVAIYSLLGQRIKNLYNAENQGQILLKWDGTNDAGQKVVSGVYLCKVNNETKKVFFKSGK